MSQRRLILPNHADGFITEELQERLGSGVPVRISFGGDSMLPMIDGNDDVIELGPVAEDEVLRRGAVYLFKYRGRCVVHRLIRLDGDKLLFRGDNCYTTETVPRSDVLARMTAVIHQGSRISCDDRAWLRRSRRVVFCRNIVDAFLRFFRRDMRRWQSPLYFFILAVLMWAPLNGLEVPLDNFILGIRLDHLLHATLYIPCAFFLMDYFAHRRPLIWWFLALLVALVTETVQYMLPYRGFDINDLVANFFGVAVGWLPLFVYKRKHPRINK